jgi:4-diphosphocytidyl-2-C-methyl-D-erythritol kinase
MITQKSYTRITLALDIIRKLTEGDFAGYHELHIVKHQIDLFDLITIESAASTCITCNNPAVPLDAANICWKVVDIVRNTFAITESVHISLAKTIPVQGGLAGGSANAATVLSMLNIFWELNLSREQLCFLGRKTGMDVPFYFYGNTAFDTESTGIINPIHTTSHFDFILVIPSFGVSTKEAYTKIDYSQIAYNQQKTNAMIEALETNKKDIVIANTHNDFENSVFRQFSALEEIKTELLKKGCLASFMSGSGSTIVGVAQDKDHASWVQKHLPYKTLVVSTFR